MELSKYLEYNIYKSKVFSKILSPQQIQIDNLNADLSDLENQAYICSATWGLKYWEQELGLNTLDSDTIENRRSRCLAKLRGYGNCTIDYIKEIAKSYNYGDIEILEDFEHYKFTIVFTSKVGVPPKMEDFKETLREIVPAHLGIEYKFTYITWGETKNKKWEELQKITWDEVLNGKNNKIGGNK